MNAPERVFTDSLREDFLWSELRVPRFMQSTPALFLDRDGVMIEETGYISDADKVVLLPGIGELIEEARRIGMAVVEVTNQAGIARGYYTWQEFVQVETRLRDLLAAGGAEVDAVFACPFHPSGNGRYRARNHPWRKPNPGMLLEAAKLLNLTLTRSMLVGDKASDQEAARSAQLACGIHVLTGYGQAERDQACSLAASEFPVYVVENLREAASLLAQIAGVAMP